MQSNIQKNGSFPTNKPASQSVCLPANKPTSHRPYQAKCPAEMSPNETTTHPPSWPARQQICKLTIPEASQLFSQLTSHFPHTENMLHFHLMRCVEVKNEQSQRHEISHLTLPCSLSNTHYSALWVLFSISLSSVFLILCPLLCVCVCVCVSVHLLFDSLSARLSEIVERCRIEVWCKVFLTALRPQK